MRLPFPPQWEELFSNSHNKVLEWSQVWIICPGELLSWAVRAHSTTLKYFSYLHLSNDAPNCLRDLVHRRHSKPCNTHCQYLSSISWSLLRATSHCASAVVWSISSQTASSMLGTERPLGHVFTPWPSTPWCVSRAHSLATVQSSASVNRFFLNGHLGGRSSRKKKKEKKS